jgi:hypothetical protein
MTTSILLEEREAVFWVPPSSLQDEREAFS